MTAIPDVFNDMIRKELVIKGVNVQDIPQILTVDYLAPYGVTGSPLRPILKVVIPKQFMICYGKHIFTSKCTSPYMPQDKLKYAKIYLAEGTGIYKYVGKIMPDSLVGIYVEPIYTIHGNSHHWYEVNLVRYDYSLTFTYVGEKSHHMHIYNGKLMITDLMSEPTVDIEGMIRHLEKYKVMVQQFEKLHTLDKLYINIMLMNQDYTCPYPQLNKILKQLPKAIDHAIDLVVKFNLHLGSETVSDTDLKHLAIQISYFDIEQIKLAILKHKWDIIEVMLTRTLSPQISDQLLTWINAEHSYIFGLMPEQLLYKIYKKRSSIITNRISIELHNAGRLSLARHYHLAHLSFVYVKQFQPLSYDINITSSTVPKLGILWVRLNIGYCFTAVAQINHLEIMDINLSI